MLNEQVVKELHEKKIRVIPWTVNEVSDMIAIKKMGCDGLITDYPNRAKGIME
jgi:glycerophosphoryl diester phosphodiesterase